MDTSPPRLRTRRPGQLTATLRRGATFALSVALFALALLLVREGIAPIASVFDGVLRFGSTLDALGFGWLFASLALSGSPVAAAALSFLDAGLLTPDQAFAMVAGSRLGAAFIVLVIGFVHMLRGRHRTLSLGAGLLSLLVTQSTYLLVVPLGLTLLRQDWLSLDRLAGADVTSPFELLLKPVVEILAAVLPQWSFLPIGFLLLLSTFRLFDRALPELHLESSRAAGLNRLLYRPIVSFALGALLTTLTLSVSVSLGLLVPLSVRGYIRQENVVPYALGANITTFVDTLLAAALLGNPTALTIVMVQMVSVALVSVAIIVFGMRAYERLLSRLTATIGRSRGSLSLYLMALFLVPLALLVGG